MTASGGEILVRTLMRNAVDTVFCVPGESFIAVLDAFYGQPVRVVACRHEAGAANMAEAYGKLGERPGVAFVTRGPGATHAAIGVHTAMQDSTPMVLFVGQVARGARGREAFQEIDYAHFFGAGVAKWAFEIDDARRIPELVTRAFRVAMSGRPGPVVLALPEDMLRDRVEAELLAPAGATVAAPGAAALGRLRALLAQAQRPLLILGGSGWGDDGCAAIRQFAQRNDLPVLCSFRRQHLFDNRDPRYAGDLGLGGDPALSARVREADLLLAVGGRLSEVPSGGYRLIAAPRSAQRLIHVHADPEELGRVFEPDLAINAGPAATALALAGLEPVDASHRAAWRAAARADYEASLASAPAGALDLAAIVRALSATLPEDAIVCNGAGNFAGWVHRFFQYKRPRTQLAPTSGAMGYGLPAAVAAKLRHPDRVVVAFAGDGDFLMSGHELATAVQYGAAVIVIVVDNGMYGTIRMHQERQFPGRTIATDLRNPDFVALAEAYGARAAAVERTGDFAPAFAAARASGIPTVLWLRVDPEAITSRTTLAAIRAAAERA